MVSASIVVMTHNRNEVLVKTLKGMLTQDFNGEFEIIVVNDGSTDGTREILEKEFGKNKKVIIIHQDRSLPCKARNNGIRVAKNEIIVVMDDDCIPAKDWLSKMVLGFSEKNIGIVTSYNLFGGTSTAFKKTILDKVGGYDEEYGYYREDTDLVFRILEAGFKPKFVEADFTHEHEIEKPKGVIGLIKYGLERASYHKNDVLLFKKHPVSAKDFLGVRLGFIVDPRIDFAAATGTWNNGGKMSLSSPRGITFLENKSFLHKLGIIAGGISWIFIVKLYRFYGSIKFGKFLI